MVSDDGHRWLDDMPDPDSPEFAAALRAMSDRELERFIDVCAQIAKEDTDAP